MCTSWLLNTNGDPLSTVRNFLITLWPYADIEGMFIPCFQADSKSIVLRLLKTSLQLDQACPLIPFMPVNAAKGILELERVHPQARYAAVLRSCEARAFMNLQSRFPTKYNNWFIIGVDCLSSFPIQDLEWRLEKAGGVEQLQRENLRFARLGGIAPYRYRRACQMCTDPSAQNADLYICLLGLPVRQYLLVKTKDEATAEVLRLNVITDGLATTYQIAQHENLMRILSFRRDRYRERTIGGLAGDLPMDSVGFVDLIGKCAPCQKCLDACPMYNDELEGLTDYNSRANGEVSKWLGGCVGCGMCEQACPNHLPLTSIHGRLQRELVPQGSMAVM